jgi:hypothetical protein
MSARHLNNRAHAINLTSPTNTNTNTHGRRDLHGCVHALSTVLEPHSPFQPLVPSLQAIVAHESGLEVPAAVLLEK